MQSWGFLDRPQWSLMKVSLPLMKDVLNPLVKSVLMPLGLASAAGTEIHEKTSVWEPQ